MEVIELRKKWKQSIENVDERFLRMIDALYNSYKNKKEIDFFDELPADIKELLLESKKQAKQGNVKPHKDIMAKYRDKYNSAG